MQQAGATVILAAHGAALRRIVRTDRDVHVRQRAQALLRMAEGNSIAATARLLHHRPNCLRAWRTRFLAEGRAGLADRSRRGRPPKLNAAAHAALHEALARGPEAYGLPVTVWSLRDLQGMLQREQGITVSVCTVQRTLHALGYRYRRPRHDLTHRQDRDAVATVVQMLDWLQKKALLTPNDSVWSLWMSVKSTPIPTWRESGDDAAV